MQITAVSVGVAGFCPEFSTTGWLVIELELHVVGAIRDNTATAGEQTSLEVEGAVGALSVYMLGGECETRKQLIGSCDKQADDKQSEKSKR